MQRSSRVDRKSATPRLSRLSEKLLLCNIGHNACITALSWLSIYYRLDWTATVECFHNFGHFSDIDILSLDVSHNKKFEKTLGLLTKFVKNVLF